MVHVNERRSENRADGGTRTHDRLITNQLLYQLSYIGKKIDKNVFCPHIVWSY